jgi:thiamine biosynthesis lipoprotein
MRNVTAASARVGGTRVVRAEPLMGTVIAIDVREPGFPAQTLDAVFAWFREVDATFSTFRSDSEICRLSRGELGVEECSEDVQDVLGICEQIRRQSAGCFTVWDGGRCDPSALVKGWSVERASQMLRAVGARNYFINGGGDIVASGEPAPGRAWRVGIQHPEQRDRLAATLAIMDMAVATSGTYERGAHIVDPRTGGPPSGLLSMTVIGPSLAYADAYSTAAFVMGPDGASWIAGIDGYEAIAITHDHRTVWTAGVDHLLIRDGVAVATQT